MTDQHPPSQRADRLARALHQIGIWIAIPGLVGVISVDVVLRHVFSAPLLWGNEVSSLILLIVFFASLPLCTAQRAHVRMELLHKAFGQGFRRTADFLAGATGLTVSAFLAYQSVLSAIAAFEFGDGAEFIWIPYWPLLIFMGLCTLSMCASFTLEMWRSVFAPRRAEGDTWTL